MKLLFSWRKKISLLTALEKVVGLEALEKTVLKTVDRRSLLQTAAKETGQPEDELLAQVAERIGIETHPNLLDTVVVSLPKGFAISDLRRAGAVLLMRGSEIEAVACVDPELLEQLGSRVNRKKLYLAHWQLVSQCLDKIENAQKSLIEQEEKLAQIKAESDLKKLVQIGEDIIQALIQKVESYGGDNFDVNLVRSPIYTFKTADGRSATGHIAEAIRPGLENLLKRHAANNFVTINLNSGTTRENVQVTRFKEGSLYRIIWQIPDKALKNLESSQKQFVQETKEKFGAGNQSTDSVNSYPFDLSEPIAGENVVIENLEKEGYQEIKESNKLEPGFVGSFTENEKSYLPESSNVVQLNSGSQIVGNQVADRQVASNQFSHLAQQNIASPSCIMVVDDNITFLKVLERFFSSQGYHVVIAQNGQEALHYLSTEQKKPDILVCDVHMPRMNASEFLGNLRTKSYGKDMPVVMLTSDEDVEVEIKFVEQGVEAFIGKSEDPRLLLAHVKRLLENKAKFIKQSWAA